MNCYDDCRLEAKNLIKLTIHFRGSDRRFESIKKNTEQINFWMFG